MKPRLRAEELTGMISLLRDKFVRSEKERLESKIISRFRAEETGCGCIVVFEEIISVGL